MAANEVGFLLSKMQISTQAIYQHKDRQIKRADE